MNREIKFRAWDSLAEEWVNYGALTLRGAYFVNRRGSTAGFNSDESEQEAIDELRRQDIARANGVRVVQYTGLTDNSGEEVYEGDFLRYSHGSKPTREVVFDSGIFGHMGEKHTFGEIVKIGYYGQNFEIVGNRFENPELLED